jgi:hypothetical protein
MFLNAFLLNLNAFQLSPDGILDEETVGRGMSNLGRSADGSQQVYLNTSIPVTK